MDEERIWRGRLKEAGGGGCCRGTKADVGGLDIPEKGLGILP